MDACSGDLALPHLVAADFLKSSVDVEQRHVVSFTGGELLAHSEHLLPPCRGVVKHAVHRQQGHDAQHLLGAGELRRQQDGLRDRANSHYSLSHKVCCKWKFSKTTQNTEKHNVVFNFRVLLLHGNLFKVLSYFVCF